MALDGSPTNYGDFRDALNRDGYAVIKSAIPLDRATKYADEFYNYLEGLYVSHILAALALASDTEYAVVVSATVATTHRR
jgi:hypothetical protein